MTKGLPFIPHVRKLKEINNGHIQHLSRIEEGHKVIDTSIPALITVSKRYRRCVQNDTNANRKAKELIRMTVYSGYDHFARVYNKYWGKNFIPLVFPILENYILRYLPSQARILDLCCGTGQLAQLLIERGYQITGLDISKEMLRFAQENAPAGEFIVADACSFKLPDIFHAVISTFDSLNHIMTLGELTSVFRNVYTALCPDGPFLFDLNMEAGYKTDWNDNYNIVEEDHVCAIRTSYHPEERIAQFDATIFYVENGWQRSDLTLMQKCYSESEILSALEVAGFIDIHSYACDVQGNLIELTADAERAFFICRKPAETNDS